MSLPNLIYFYRRRVRARLVQEFFALLGIAVGVALLFAVQVSNTSLSASLAQLTHRLVGKAQLQLAARDPHGFDERLVREVERQPGVRAVAPLLISQGNMVSAHGERAVTLLAADPRLAHLGGTLLRGYSSGRLANVRSLVVPAPIARALHAQFGSTVTLQVAGRALAVPVGAVVGRGDVGSLADIPAVVAPLSYGQALVGLPRRISRLYVRAAPGRVDEVARGLRRLAGDRLDVLPSDSDTRVFAQAATPNNQSTALFAGISALVGFLFAFNAMLLMGRERRGVIAELRMAGFGLATVLEVLVFDALVLGAIASVLGLALGDQLSRHVFHPAPGYLSIAFPVGTSRTVEWQTVAIALAGGLVAATLAAVTPLMAALSRSAIDTVEADSIDERDQSGLLRSRWLLAAGIGTLAATVLLFFVAPQAALFGTILLVGSMLLTLPAILASALGYMHRARVHIKSVVPVIAIGELLSTRSRSVAIAAIAAIAVFATTAIDGARGDLQRGLDPNARELNALADLWISPAGSSNTLATDPFDPAFALSRLRASGITGIRAYRGGFLDLGARRVWVIAPPRDVPDPFPASQILKGDTRVAAARVRGHGWVVVSEAIAHEHGLHVGGTFTVDAPRPTTFRVAAITTNYGWSPGTIVVNADDYRLAWGSSDVSALQLDLDGAPLAAMLARVRRALGPTGLTVETARQRELHDRITTRQGLSRLSQIATLVLTAAALAIAAAMGGMVWQRRRRLADLKLAGVGYRQLWRALLLESTLLLTVGCSIGAVYGLFGERLLDRGLNRVTGFPVQESLGVPVALTSFGVVALLALMIATLPGYFAARVPTGAAFQD